MEIRLKDHSQFGEYCFLREYFKSNPVNHKILVDIGAYGKYSSNSYNLLSEDGWSGILVEPCEYNFNRVVFDFQGLNVKIFNLAVSNYSGEGVLHKSFIDEGHHSLINANHMISQENIFVRTLPELLEENKICFDFGFLSVDTEGNDIIILSDMLLNSNYRPKVIISEMQCDELMLNHKYKILKRLGCNTIYVHT
jgi:FkbM family methyltransferase